MSRNHQEVTRAEGGDAPTQRTPVLPPQPAASAVSEANGAIPAQVWKETSQIPFLVIPSEGPSARVPPQGYLAMLSRLRGPCNFRSPL